jgi:hypothetical protein
VVHGAHGVEEVGDAGYRRVERTVGDLERGVGVAGRDDDPAARGERHQFA